MIGRVASRSGLPRCPWAEGSDLERDYHDTEWGVPLHGERALFELLSLESVQSGLSWRVVLGKRAGYRAAFHAFDIRQVAAMSDAALLEVATSPTVIRNSGKLKAIRGNAWAALRVITEFGGLNAYLWSFTGGIPVVNRWTRREEVPARSELGDRMAADLHVRGFRYLGPTTCYAFMQASGMVNDHLLGCFRHPEHRPFAGPGIPTPPPQERP